MSSAISKQAQKSGRTKFLLAVTARTNDDTGSNITWNSAIQFDSTVTIPQSIITRSELIALSTAGNVEGVTLTLGSLYKDLGRELVVYDDTVVGSPHRNVFRECLLMNGASTEGADGTTANATIFIKVFSAYGSNVDVARTG
jgi:hypothetical protein